MSSATIKQLLQNNSIWQASQQGSSQPALSTGYALLDQQLHYRGWPQGSISELLISQHGMGEIRLLTPLLARLSQQPGYIVWVNPPYQPYAPALHQQGVCLQKLMVINARSVQQTIWAGQQAMSSNACSAVLVWLPDKTLNTEIRKLSLAAKNGNCWGVIFRSHNLQQHPCSAVLRIAINVVERQHQLSIIKQPGGWSGQQVNLNLFPERIYWNALAVNHWPSFSPVKAKEDELLILPALSPNLISPASTRRPADSIALSPAYH